MDGYQAAKEEIKRTVDIVELIGQFVQLKRSGQSYMGLCPFHSEKAPSFTVSPAKQMFHCFGCKKGGDLFAFWMEYHQVSFPQALKDLAEKYHVALPERDPGTPGIKEAILRANEAAADFFHHLLMKSGKGKAGRDYLQRRGIPGEIISEFKLGYAPDEWDALAKALREKKINPETALQAGLLIPRKTEGHYDRFRNRVMFPIFDLRGQIVGFGGRVLDQSLPKYLNTPETPVFQKGELLYGLHVAFSRIRESGRVVIVEGYTDALALIKHGFRGAVATLGTALTRDHIRKLKGYAREAVVVFDSDAAGTAAAMKSLSFFLDEGMPAKVMSLPDGEDPDTFVNKGGLESFQALLERSVPMFDFFIDRKMADGGKEIENRVKVLEDIFPVLAELKSHVQRALYVKRLSEKLQVTEKALAAEFQKWASRGSFGADRPPAQGKKEAKRIDDVYLLNLLLHHPGTVARIRDLEWRSLLSDPAVIEIVGAILSKAPGAGPIDLENILAGLSGQETQEVFREAMLSPSIFPEEEVERALQDFAEKILRIKIQDSAAQARAKGDFETYNRILKLKKERDVQPRINGNSQEGM
ncbi:protein containing DNA primase, DnaG // TOPRIM [sediment metagenome]|uniref:Protein containing DNA primase, DnaG // TOPRIM n=1 Tax=sediment metagenome TaxID=749907 RepID=D9PI89_9ZZZZ